MKLQRRNQTRKRKRQGCKIKHEIRETK